MNQHDEDAAQTSETEGSLGEADASDAAVASFAGRLTGLGRSVARSLGLGLWSPVGSLASVAGVYLVSACAIYWAGIVWFQVPPTLGVGLLLAITGVTIHATICILRLCVGEQISRPLGVLLLCIWPVIGGGCYFFSLVQAVQQRKSVEHGVTMILAGLAGESFGRCQAWISYPRRCQGRHVELAYRGELQSPEKIVGRMDRHVDAMYRVLGHVPSSSTRCVPRSFWIRGRILGFNGRAIGGMAITKDTGSPALNYLDRHEVAHTAISLLGQLHQQPPSLIAEGWAQSQSVDPGEMRETLRQKLRSGNTRPLVEFMSPERYGATPRTVYDHGGPFVAYLIDRYGGKRFLRLYHSIRRETFPDDFRRVYGKSLRTLESDFWHELAAGDLVRDSANADAPLPIPREASVDDAQWERFVELVVAAERCRRNTLDRLNQRSKTTIALAATEQIGDRSVEAELILAADRFQSIRRSAEVIDYALQTDRRSIRIRRRGGAPLRRVHQPTGPSPEFYRVRYFDAASLVAMLPLMPDRVAQSRVAQSRQRYRITGLESPTESNGNRWRVQWIFRPESAVEPRHFFATIDPASQFQIVELVAGDNARTAHTLAEIGGLVFPVETVTDDYRRRIQRLDRDRQLAVAAELADVAAATRPAVSTAPVWAPWLRPAGVFGLLPGTLAALFLSLGTGSWRLLVSRNG